MPLGMLISPLALYNEDSHIFDDMELPDEPANHYDDIYSDLMRPVSKLFSFDRTSFIQYLLLETAELSTIYTNPETFKFAVKVWSKTHIKIWKQLFDTLFFRYNPIWNKDGTIKELNSETRNFANSLGITGSITHGKAVTTDYGHPTETLTRTGGKTSTVTDTRKTKDTHSGTDTTTDTLAHTETDSFSNYIETHKITQDDTTGSVSAFNVSGFSNRDKTEHVLTETNSPTGSKIKTLGGGNDVSATQHGEVIERETVSGTLVTQDTYNVGGEVETKTFSGLDETRATESGTTGNSETRTGSETETGSHNINKTEQGNIGITTTQKMIQEEREVIKFNLYEYILEDFKQHFLVLIY